MGKGEWWNETWGVVAGCSPVSAGCANCWAQSMLKRFGKPLTPTLHPEKLDEPLHWRKPRTVFVAPMGDLFHEAVPDEFIDRVFAAMTLTPQHTYMLLTKRPARMKAYLTWRDDKWPRFDGSTETRTRHDEVVEAIANMGLELDDWPTDAFDDWPLPNVWLGVSVEDQATADERIPLLLDTPAAHRWVSAEPLLSQLDLAPWLPTYRESYSEKKGLISEMVAPVDYPPLNYLVTAPESGPRRRYCDLDWVRSLRDQCEAAQVPFMLKHWYHGKAKVSLPLLDGRRLGARP